MSRRIRSAAARSASTSANWSPRRRMRSAGSPPVERVALTVPPELTGIILVYYRMRADRHDH
jgi:hypothetical protein